MQAQCRHEEIDLYHCYCAERFATWVVNDRSVEIQSIQLLREFLKILVPVVSPDSRCPQTETRKAQQGSTLKPKL